MYKNYKRRPASQDTAVKVRGVLPRWLRLRAARARQEEQSRTRRGVGARLATLTSESKHKATKQQTNFFFLLGTAAAQPRSLSPLVYSPALLLSCSCPAFVLAQLTPSLGLHDGTSSGQELQTWQRAEAPPAHRIDNHLQVLRASRPSPAS